MVPISEYDIELQELSQPPPIPAQVMTPPPFAPEPKEFLTPPPLSINVPEFYQLYIMHNGIEEPITSFSQFMPETVPPPQSQPPRREVSNKITKIFPVSSIQSPQISIESPNCEFQFVENRQPKRIQATPEVSSYLNHPIMDDGYVQLPPQTFPPHQFAHRQPLPPPFVFMDQPRMMPPPPPFMGGHPMVIPFQGHPPMMPQYFHMVPVSSIATF